ncbi:uncharacterized protein KQ657_001254 [Scheffersomyces spartinae]|uniref:DNA replication regulator Sld3 C-terminal domain-containing protein n=1 Tax=Scheffersomyces spartinae TaxID=45513 RepID=A0A9P7V7P8_9ASCO|nr:uncharacterized protein KQ657_001254 [Scheffersomyces spartinae]KAG7192799.1 hypothetical protein KQ657_001254 [Scheffersomyces spartinae]
MSPYCPPITLTNGDHQIRITTINTFSGINLESFESVDLHYFEPNDLTLKALRKVHDPYMFVDVQQHAQLANGVMFEVLDRVYGVIVFGSQCFLETVTGGVCKSPILLQNNNTSDDVLQQLQTSNDRLGLKLSAANVIRLKPPSQTGTVTGSIGTSVADPLPDPLTFISTRYYSMLYSTSTPLSYFSKTAFTRLMNLCSSSKDTVSQILAQLVLTIEDFDRRHQGKYGCLIGLDPDHWPSSRSGSEELAHSSFISKFKDTIDMVTEGDPEGDGDPDGDSDFNKSKMLAQERLGTLLLDLKVREAQLQILVTLELLWLQISDESLFLEKCQKEQENGAKKAQKMVRSSLVRKNKLRRKIVPTFLGMGVQINYDNRLALPMAMALPPSGTTIDEFALFSILSNLMERLNLWDTLRTKKSTTDSSKSFLAYVVVPYYSKKMPVMVKFLIEKIKGVSFKGKRRGGDKARTSKSESENNKHLKREIKRPTLKHSLSGIEDLRPAVNLRRSKSSLSSSKNLERRQVDVSVSLKSFTESTTTTTKPETVSSNVEAPSQSFIFTRGRKSSNSQISTATKQPSYAQVEATPMKHNRLSQVIDTPMTKSDTKLIPSSSTKKFSLNDRLKAASFLEEEGQNLKMNPPATTTIDSSPILTRTVIGSSPMMTRTIIDSSPPLRRDRVIDDSSPASRNKNSTTSVNYNSYGESPSKKQKLSSHSQSQATNYYDTDEDQF